MRIYLSAQFGRRLEMRQVADPLRRSGHVVVSTWHDSDDEDDDVNSPGAGEKAEKDLNDIMRAQVFAAFTDGAHGRGGRHAEFGIARGNCRLVVVGPVEHHFHRLWFVEHVANVAELIKLLEAGQ